MTARKFKSYVPPVAADDETVHCGGQNDKDSTTKMIERNLTIHIDMDRRCTRCRRPGATDGGLCLECIAKGIRRGDYDYILKKAEKRGKK